MVTEELYINDILIPTTNGINPSITYSIADIQEPSKRKTYFSKTINLPDSKITNEVFGLAFEINLVDGTFNPSLKASMLLLVDGLENMRGYVQLKSISVTDNNDISYNVVLFGELGNLFTDIKDKYLHDVDLSEYDHPLVEEAQRLSWDTSILVNGVLEPFEYGRGYVYPLIDYGYSSDGLNYRVDELGCAIYLKEYWDRIFTENGYTYTSDFLDSDFFKHLIIPSSPTAYSLTEQQIADREFSANTPVFNGSGTTTDIVLPQASYSSARLVEFTNEIADPNNLWQSDNRFIVQEAGNYTITVTMDLGVTMTPTNLISTIEASSEVRGVLSFYKNFGQIDSTPFYISPTASTSGARTTDLTPTAGDQDYRQFPYSSALVFPPARTEDPPNRYTLTYTGFLNVGDDLRVYYSAGQFLYPGATNYFTGGSGGTAQLVSEVGVVFNKSLNQNIGVGTTLPVNTTIPTDVKQTDFMTTVINMFNLYLEPDKFNSKNLIIEPYNDYYLETNVIDWQEKHDISKPTIIKPISQAKALNYIFKYKDDKDYYNELYTSAWSVSYGEREVQSINEFLKGDEKTELIFSPTPLVANPSSPIVTPTIIGSDDLGQATQTKHNIRVLYYGGLKGEPDGSALVTPWKHYDPLINFAWNRYYYPYAGHFDDPFNATLDINFGLVNEVYYDSPLGGINVTTNNLYNKYHSRLINNILDVNGKTIEGYFLLNALDIYNFSFRYLYYHNNAYWRLIKISNYNPTNYEPVKCEFLKVNEDFNDGTIETISVRGNRSLIVNSGDGANQNENTPVLGNNFGLQKDGNSFNKKTTTIQGKDNYVNKLTENIDIQGDDNKVFSKTKNISLINSNGNTIEGGVENVTLINSNDLTIIDSNVTYIDGIKVVDPSGGGSKFVTTVNSDATITTGFRTYLVDTSLNDVDITLPSGMLDGQEWNIKKIDNNNKLSIAYGGLVDGVIKQQIFNLNTSITVVYDEANDTYKII